jgi:hypothetical protein
MTTISKTISYGIVPFIRRKEEILVFLVKTKEKAKYGATKGKIRVDESVF